MKKSVVAAAAMFVFTGVLTAGDMNVPKIDQDKLNRAAAVAEEKGQEAKQKSEELNTQKVKAAQTVEKAGAATETGGEALQQKSAEVGGQQGKNSKITAKVASKAAKTGKTRAVRGQLKEQILNELKSAGATGITIKDLAAKLNANYKNVYIWFVTTGKRIAGIKKVGPAQYKLEAAA